MASNKENSRAPASASGLLVPNTSRPLPPLPPSDANELLQSTRQVPPPQARKFGVRIPDNIQATTSDKLTASKTLSSSATETTKATQRESFQHHWTQNAQLNAEEENPHDNKKDIDTDKHLTGTDDFEPSGACPTLSLINPPPPRSSPQQSSTQPGRTIWSITPDELSALAMEMALMKQKTPEPTRKLSYAEASKRSLLGLDGRQAAQKPETEEVEQLPTRTFKKYYGLPIIPLSRLPPWWLNCFYCFFAS